ncbi:MAG: type IV pilus biogenesis protein PilM [Anaerobacillus sp.]|uniref:type IV pilus biogenesis protein PilM n=1 Tax=Anaerobacillus sp. TaxID=1872506 RepID=UPI00391A0323
MFLPKSFSGLDFRDQKITFATIKMEKNLPVITHVAINNLNSHLLDGGRLHDSVEVSSKLRSFLSDKGASKLVHIAIPTQFTIVRKLNTLPDLGELELSRLLHFQIGDSIHLPFDDPAYDFVKIGSIHPQKTLNLGDEDLNLDDLAGAAQEEMKGSRSEILFFATSKLLAEDLAKASQSAGFKPRSAEIRGLALQRLVNYANPSWLTGTELIVDVSEESIDLHIFKDELIIFTRTMPINRNQYMRMPAPVVNEQTLVLEAESGELAFFDNDDTLTLSEIEIDNTEVAATDIKEVSDHQAQFDEEAYINDLINEIERAQNFYRYSLGERDSEFRRVIVTGENANRAFTALLERMNSEVCRIDYSSVVAPGFMQHQLLDMCSVAIGLAMRENEKIDKKWKK